MCPEVTRMNVIPAKASVGPPGLIVDLVGDFSCPWSFLGMRRLARALGNLQGGEPVLRWHPFRLSHEGRPLDWQQLLAARLPAGVTPAHAEQSLVEAGRDLGVKFAFDRLARVPDTTEAHRLTKLAAREDRQDAIIEAIYRAYFEQALDIGDRDILARIAAEAGLSEALIAQFRDSAAAQSEIAEEEQRLRLLGVTSIPNLLFNGRVLVPGPADEATYLQAIDQALFPQPTDPAAAPRLH